MPPEIGARAGPRGKEEENVVDEREPVAFSTLSEAKSIAISELVKAMVVLCFIYDIDVRKLAEEHELGVIDDVNENINLVMLGTLYNIQGDQKNYRAEYDVFGSNNMNDMA